MSWTDTVERYLVEWPNVSGGKGEGAAKEQMKQQNAMQKQAFDAQMATLNQLKSSLGQYLTGNVGYDPQQLALMQSQFQNQTANQYGQAAQAVRQGLLARGSTGQNPMSGTDVRGLLGLEGAKANTLSQGTLGLGINNLQQALANRFNTANIFSGNAATLSSPISSFGAGASNALNQYVQASNSGFGATFMRGLGGTLGEGLGKMATSGFGKIAGSLGGSSSAGSPVNAAPGNFALPQPTSPWGMPSGGG